MHLVKARPRGITATVTAGPRADSMALTDTTATSPDGSGQWGSEQLTFSDVTGETQVFAEMVGHRRDGDTGVTYFVRVSFDGGSTWEDGPAVRSKGSLGVTDRMPVSNLLFATGEPTGDVVLDVQWETDGTVGDAELEAGYLRAEVYTAPATDWSDGGDPTTVHADFSDGGTPSTVHADYSTGGAP